MGKDQGRAGGFQSLGPLEAAYSKDYLTTTSGGHPWINFVKVFEQITSSHIRI
jgi:hypothetical protein